MAPTRKCALCNKSVVQEILQCCACRACYHPGCAKRKVRADGAPGCCVGGIFSTLTMACADPPASAVADVASRSPMTPRATLDDVVMALASINMRLDTISARLDGLPAMQAQIDNNTSRITALETSNQALQQELRTLKHAHRTDQEELRRTSVLLHPAELIISGVPCTSDANLKGSVQEVARAIDCPLGEADIISTRYLIPRSRAQKDSPLPIVVTLNSKATLSRLLAARKAKGRVQSSELPSSSSSDHVWMVGLREALPRSLYQLLAAVRQEAKEKGYKYVWHRDGMVFVRKEDGHPVKRIRSVDDLSSLPSN